MLPWLSLARGNKTGPEGRALLAKVHREEECTQHFLPGPQHIAGEASGSGLMKPESMAADLAASFEPGVWWFHYQVKEDQHPWAFKDRKPKRRIAALTDSAFVLRRTKGSNTLQGLSILYLIGCHTSTFFGVGLHELNWSRSRHSSKRDERKNAKSGVFLLITVITGSLEPKWRHFAQVNTADIFMLSSKLSKQNENMMKIIQVLPRK